MVWKIILLRELSIRISFKLSSFMSHTLITLFAVFAVYKAFTTFLFKEPNKFTSDVRGLYKVPNKLICL